MKILEGEETDLKNSRSTADFLEGMVTRLERRKLGSTGLEVTFLGYGALEIGRDWGLGEDTERQRPDSKEAGRVLNGVLDLGINLIDTARAYHRSEERIGRWISHRRDEFVLTSKCGEHSAEPDTYYDFSYKAVRDSIDLSLKLLRVEYIDVMQIHYGGPHPERILADGETVKAMQEAREAGKVRFLGASPPVHLLDQCIESGYFDVLQVGYSLLDRAAEPLIEKAAARGIGILVRSPLAGGRLTPRVAPYLERDRTLRNRLAPLLELVDGDLSRLPSLGLAFLRSNRGVSSVLVGSKNLEHVKANIFALEHPPSSEVVAEAARLTCPTL